MTSKSDKLKLISRVCNSSSNIEQFIVNLDLMNMTLDEAERLYEDNCKHIIKHMSCFWCQDRKFKFSRVFDNVVSSYYEEHDIIRFALPYRLSQYFDKDKYCKHIVLYAVNASGKDIDIHMLIDDIEKTFSGVDVFHESFMQLMCDLTHAVRRT